MSTQIVYVGKRETYRDGMFGTGEWTRGETKRVHDEIAARMLRHADQYVRGSASDDGYVDVVGAPGPMPGPEEESSDGLRDLIAAMDKESLSDYAKVHFSTDIDKRLGVEKLRAQVLGLVDQYGVE